MDSTKVNRRAWWPLVAVGSALMLAATLLPVASASAAVGSPPQNLVATAGPGAVELAWDAPAQDAATVTGYFIRRRLPDEGETRFTTLVADTGSAETTYTDLTANSDGTRYEYRIKARWDNARSSRSNTAEAVGQAESQAESTEEPGGVIGTSLEYVGPAPTPDPVTLQQNVRDPALLRTAYQDDRYAVQDFKVYYWGYGGLQTGDFLEWIGPSDRWAAQAVESYTIQRQTRTTGSGWSSWTTLETIDSMTEEEDGVNFHGRARYTITEYQPACTDWSLRVWANFDGESDGGSDGTRGPWSKKFSMLSRHWRCA